MHCAVTLTSKIAGLLQGYLKDLILVVSVHYAVRLTSKIIFLDAG